MTWKSLQEEHQILQKLQSGDEARIKDVLVLISSQPKPLEPMEDQLKYSLVQLLSTTSDEDIIKYTCAILGTQSIELDLDLLKKAFGSPVESVQSLALTQISRRQQLSKDLIDLLVLALESPSILIYQKARDVICSIAPAEYKHLSDGFLERLDRANLMNELRLYETIAKLVVNHHQAFEYFKTQGLLDYFASIDINDYLGSLNTISILTELTGSVNAEFFAKLGILNDIDQKFDQMVSLLKCASVKFWGFLLFNVKSDKEFELVSFQRIFEKLSGLISSENQSEREQTIVTIGNIGSSKLGLLRLINQQELMKTTMSYLKNSIGDSRIVCLKTLACFLDHANDDISAECLSIYRELSVNPCENLLNFASSLALDIAIPALACLKAIVAFDWGLEAFINAPNFRIVLERRSELPVEIIEWRYSIVQAIVRSEHGKNIVNKVVFVQMSQFEKQGPFKSEYAPSVAFESGM